MSKLVIEIKGEDAEKIMTAFHNKEWKDVAKSVCKAMKEAGECTEKEAEGQGNKPVLEYPDKWDTEIVYGVIQTQQEATTALKNVMLYMATASDIPENLRKPIWDIVRLAHDAEAAYTEMLDNIGEDGYIPERDEGYEWDDEDDWCDDWCLDDEDEDDEND